MLWLGTVASLSGPAAFVMACGTDLKQGQNNNNGGQYSYYVENVKPLDFREIFGKAKFQASEPKFNGGINFTAYTQGMSFVLNILRGLGWNWEDPTKIANLYDDAFDFSSINPREDPTVLASMKDANQEFEKRFSDDFSESYEDGISQFIKAQDQVLVSPLYQQIKSLVYVHSEQDNISQVDASTKVAVDLGAEFSDLDYEAKLRLIASKLNDIDIVNKIFKNKRYAYDWSGNALEKLGFQIKGDTLFLWQMSNYLPKIYKSLANIRVQNKKMQEHIVKNSLRPSDRKNLVQVFLDPLGVDGTMNDRFFFTNTNVKHSTDRSLLKSKSTVYGFTKYFNESNKIYEFGGVYNWSNGVDKKWKKQVVASYGSFLDASQPGTVILKMFSGDPLEEEGDNPESIYSLKTFETANRFQIFYRLQNKQKIRQLANLVYDFLIFLQNQVRSNVEEVQSIKQFGTPILNSAFEFLRNNEIKEQEVIKQFKKYNNGSHYMLAVEIFLRGMKNIPKRLLAHFQVPTSIEFYLGINAKKFQRKKNEIVGMNNTKSILPILYLAYTSGEEIVEGAHNKQFNYNPQTRQYDRGANLSRWVIINFAKDLTSEQKTGTEIPFYKS